MVPSTAREAIVVRVMTLAEGFFVSMRAWQGDRALYVAEHSALPAA